MRRNAANSGQSAVDSGQRAAAGTAAKRWSAAAKRRLPIPNPQSPISLPPAVPRPSPPGFTLVELLVVIVIISMLTGLLMPALISARGRARITQCTNNQHELGLAIQQYDVAKQHLPGYINATLDRTPPTARSVAISWVPVLFPYLGRMDLWEDTVNGWRSHPIAAAANAPRLNQLVCPDSEAVEAAALTYVVNVGAAYVGTSDTPSSYFTAAYETGVFRNLVPTVVSGTTIAPRPITGTNIRSAGQRPMLSERQYPLDGSVSPVNAATADRVWNYRAIAVASAPSFEDTELYNTGDTPVVKLTGVQLGFPWPDLSPNPQMPLRTALPPIHPGIVIVTFCDGHTDALSEDTDVSVYDHTAIQ